MEKETRFTKYTYNPELEEFNDRVYKRIKLLLKAEQRIAGLTKVGEAIEKSDELEELELFKSEGKTKEDISSEVEFSINENTRYRELMNEMEIEELMDEGRLRVKDFRVYTLKYSWNSIMIAALLQSDSMDISQLRQKFPYVSHLGHHFSPHTHMYHRLRAGTPIDVPFIQTSEVDETEYGRVYIPFYFDVPEEDEEEILSAAEASKSREIKEL